jgi:Mor family transcriptional regulator
MVKAKTERNAEMYDKYLNPDLNYSLYSLSREYNISPPMVWRVIQRERKRREREGVKNEK